MVEALFGIKIDVYTIIYVCVCVPCVWLNIHIYMSTRESIDEQGKEQRVGREGVRERRVRDGEDRKGNRVERRKGEREGGREGGKEDGREKGGREGGREGKCEIEGEERKAVWR